MGGDVVVESSISSGVGDLRAVVVGLASVRSSALADAGAKEVNTCLDSREGIVSTVLVQRIKDFD
jgi:hypothetical protein